MSDEERRQKLERRIPPSGRGRLKFRPGDPHVLDVQLKEARNYRALIAEQIAQLQQVLAAFEQQDDPSVQISQEEGALKAFLWETYKEHKHRDHILACFLSIRRQRLLARLEAARNALELAGELLAPDERILRDLRHAVEQAQAHARERAANNKAAGQRPLPEPEEEEEEGDQQPQQAQEEETHQSDEGAEEEETRAVDHRHIYGDANALKAQLAAFDERVKQMRGAISAGIGWFEEYYIYKERLTYEARQYIMRGEEPPEGIPLTEIVAYGPYLKWRTRESGIKGAPIITVQMGLIPDDELAAAKQWAEILGLDGDDNEAWPQV